MCLAQASQVCLVRQRQLPLESQRAPSEQMRRKVFRKWKAANSVCGPREHFCSYLRHYIMWHPFPFPNSLINKRAYSIVNDHMESYLSPPDGDQR